MGDIIERAEEVLKWGRTSATYRTLGKLVPELVAEVKRLRGQGKLDAGTGRWVAELTWNGQRHYRSAPTRHEAHVALMELRKQLEAEQGDAV